MTPQRLGQNFLADERWRLRIAQVVLGPQPLQDMASPAVAGAEEPSSGNVWIEIGAGHGEMTELLAKNAGRVVAIELDSRLLPGLTRRMAPFKNVTVVSGDVLDLDLAALAAVPRFSVYGNLPYYITSPIVHQLLGHADQLESAFLVVQLEVAERLVAPPGGRDRGYFSAFVQFYSTPEIMLRIPPGAFRPPPKVKSALVALRPSGERLRLEIGDEPAFMRFLKLCFAQKRKMIRNNLHSLLPAASAQEAILQAGIASDARAEQLSLADLARLFTACRGMASS